MKQNEETVMKQVKIFRMWKTKIAARWILSNN